MPNSRARIVASELKRKRPSLPSLLVRDRRTWKHGRRRQWAQRDERTGGLGRIDAEIASNEEFPGFHVFFGASATRYRGRWGRKNGAAPGGAIGCIITESRAAKTGIPAHSGDPRIDFRQLDAKVAMSFRKFKLTRRS